jgi:energy-coupling factor transporter ATP-binding protein EcfA2
VIPRTIESAYPFGAIAPAPGFSFKLQDGYTALFGLNGSGKSSILQLIFKTLVNDAAFGRDHVVYIEAERGWVSPTTEVQGQTIADYNRGLASQFPDNGPSNTLSYTGFHGNNPGDLPKYLLNHKNFSARLRGIEELLPKLGLPVMTLEASQQLHFDDILAAYQGSGLRFILPILAAVLDPVLDVILIDEPEACLEPALAKRLRDLLIERASGRAIVVASHSHLFIDRQHLAANFVVRKDDGHVQVEPVGSRSQLVDLVFTLLGNSTLDLLLPSNFLVVEGGSDQLIVDRVLELLKAPAGGVKVYSGQGIDNVHKAVAAIDTIQPLLHADGPYARSVVALIDRPRKGQQTRADVLRSQMGPRLFELTELSIEEYLPESLYRKAGLDKAKALAEIAARRGDYEALAAYKTGVAKAVSAKLVARDLRNIAIIRDAARKALGSVQGSGADTRI